MHRIRKVAVIGAGVMGAGIAAQVANAGVPVLLLDVVKDPAASGGAADRNAVAAGAVARLLNTEPAAFMAPAAARLVEVGNVEDDLAKLAGCDWVIEVVVERLDVKQALYRRIEAARRPGTVVSSNTSTIPLAQLLAGMPEQFARDFVITHFFNPPRYMRLLEIVTGGATDPAIVEQVSTFADVKLGKTVVFCKDTPGFIANRLGTYWLQLAVSEAFALGLSVEAADAVLGRPFGIPKTGVFGLLDLVGLDLIPHVNESLARALPAGDPFHATEQQNPLVTRMIAEGYTGRKGKGGFYRVQRAGGEKVKQAIDLATGDYRPAETPDLPELKEAGRNLRALLGGTTPAARYAWRVIGQTLAYAARLVPEAADDIPAIDAAMRLGYNWSWGPFELADRIGVDWLIARLAGDGIAVPDLLRQAAGQGFYRVMDGRRQVLHAGGAFQDIVRPEGELLLEDIKLSSKPLLKNASAAVWDIGDGVVCFEFTSKSNSLDAAILTLLGQTIKLVAAQYKALVIYNEGRNFSLGANLGLALFAANIGAWGEIDKLIGAGQQTYTALKYAPFPVVAAPAGMALGGGCEILLHSDAVQAHAESYIGLVECGVGLLPAWGGCKEMLGRLQTESGLPNGPMPAPARLFEIVSTATVSKSAAEAKALGFLRPTDGITMNRDRLLEDAKERALALVPGYQPPAPRAVTLPGPSGRLAMVMAAEGFQRRGLATTHDLTVAGTLATVLSGGEADLLDPVGEQQILDLERDNFLRLMHTTPTLARIEHTLETGRPLRN